MERAAPVIETERLRLRPFRAEDLDFHVALESDPQVVRYLGSEPRTREQVWRKMLCAPGMWALLGFGYWAVERIDDAHLIGQCGFGDFKRDLEPSIEGLPEMGWVFAASAHGQGYASEAVRAALGWADATLPGAEIPAIIDPENGPSIRLAERCGFGTGELTSYKGEPILLFRRLPRRPALPAAAAPAAPASA